MLEPNPVPTGQWIGLESMIPGLCEFIRRAVVSAGEPIPIDHLDSFIWVSGKSKEGYALGQDMTPAFVWKGTV